MIKKVEFGSRHVFFFFKQKTAYEIGVTGVQTCALPISSRGGHRRGPQNRRRGYVGLRDSAEGLRGDVPGRPRCRGGGPRKGARDGRRPGRPLGHRRSEERRVGKECRSRWSPYHSKKNRR